MQLYPEIQARIEEMTAWRRAMHARPELGFEEVETSRFVAETLRSWGVETHTGVAGTGVVGVIRGTREGPMLGLRADMDALPIQEQAKDRPHRSKAPGRMHACGHDGHTAMLLGAARALVERRDFRGAVALIFQPAEEGLGGGLAMIEAGLFERFPCQWVFALHNAPPLPLGTAAVHSGAVCAGAATFVVRLTGAGGHAAMPHYSVDPIPAAACLVQAINAIPARRLPPEAAAVVGVSAIQAGDAFNIIPEVATLKGTVRAFAADVLARVRTELEQLARGIGDAHGVAAEVDFRIGCPPTVNDPAEADVAARALGGVLGPGAVRRDMAPVTGSEDFAFMLERRPGAYVLLGAGGEGESPMLHTPEFDFEDRLLPIGASFFVKLVELKLA